MMMLRDGERRHFVDHLVRNERDPRARAQMRSRIAGILSFAPLSDKEHGKLHVYDQHRPRKEEQWREVLRQAGESDDGGATADGAVSNGSAKHPPEDATRPERGAKCSTSCEPKSRRDGFDLPGVVGEGIVGWRGGGVRSDSDSKRCEGSKSVLSMGLVHRRRVRIYVWPKTKPSGSQVSVDDVLEMQMPVDRSLKVGMLLRCALRKLDRARFEVGEGHYEVRFARDEEDEAAQEAETGEEEEGEDRGRRIPGADMSLPAIQPNQPVLQLNVHEVIVRPQRRLKVKTKFTPASKTVDGAATTSGPPAGNRELSLSLSQATGGDVEKALGTASRALDGKGRRVMVRIAVSPLSYPSLLGNSEGNNSFHFLKSPIAAVIVLGANMRIRDAIKTFLRVLCGTSRDWERWTLQQTSLSINESLLNR